VIGHKKNLRGSRGNFGSEEQPDGPGVSLFSHDVPVPGRGARKKMRGIPNNSPGEAVKRDMKKILILLAVVLAVSTPLAPQASAIDFSISVGDRPYYHGGGYWHQGYYWVWVPGHYSHSRGGWVPGHYARRGGYDRHHANIYFRHHRVWH
jgi:hypothetical protein